MVLALPIKKRWLDMIRSGEKKEEYREIKEYYNSRIGSALCGLPFRHCEKNFIKKCMQERTIEVIFRNGYGYDSPSIWCTCKLRVGQGKEEWGAIPGKKYYILEILEILSVQNMKGGK